jgi:hypothetical protein
VIKFIDSQRTSIAISQLPPRKQPRPAACFDRSDGKLKKLCFGFPSDIRYRDEETMGVRPRAK